MSRSFIGESGSRAFKCALCDLSMILKESCAMSCDTKINKAHICPKMKLKSCFFVAVVFKKHGLSTERRRPKMRTALSLSSPALNEIASLLSRPPPPPDLPQHSYATVVWMCRRSLMIVECLCFEIILQAQRDAYL